MEIANELREQMIGFPPPGNARLIEIAKIEDISVRYEALNEYKEELRNDTLRRTREHFEKHPMHRSAFALQYGISESMAHRISKGERAIPVDILVQVCYTEFMTSCTELIFGEKPKIVVPNEISAVLCRVKDNTKFKSIANGFGKKCVTKIIQRSDSDLLQKRINERVDQVGLVIREQMAYYPWYSALYKRLRFSAKENEKLPGHLSSLLVTSWSVGLPIDYLLAPDYTQHADLYYLDGVALVKVPWALYPLVSVYLRLNEPDRAALITQCMST